MMEKLDDKTVLCHCDRIADKYRTRTYINQIGYTVFKCFYRCRNCWSRVYREFCPELDALPKVNVFDLLKSKSQNNGQ